MLHSGVAVYLGIKREQSVSQLGAGIRHLMPLCPDGLVARLEVCGEFSDCAITPANPPSQVCNPRH